jgi:hypothetical protein
MRRILLLTGMTPDRRIFDRLLPLLSAATVVDWIPPTPYESITSYAEKLSRTIDRDDLQVSYLLGFESSAAFDLDWPLHS